MFSRIFGKALPGPTTDQEATDLQPFSQGCDEEITAAAYEPRYSIFAIGTVSGRLLAMNRRRAIVASNVGMGVPICTLKPCPNSSSFVALSSPYSLLHHPGVILAMNGNKISESVQKFNKSYIAHWILTPERAVPRIATVKDDIVDICVSPSTPNFAMVLQKDGSLIGFSFEKMKFTELYINHFEKLHVKSLSCTSGMNYFIAHDKIECVDIQTMEADTFSTQTVRSLDVFNGYAAVINDLGKAQLLKGNKVVQEIKDSELGGIAILSQIISGENWIAVYRTPIGDEIYINSNKVACPQGLEFIPSVMINYKSYFERSEPIFIRLITKDAKMCTVVDGVATISEIFPPKISPELAWNDKGKVFSFQKGEEENTFTMHVMTKNSYIYGNNYKLPLPVSYDNGYFVCPSADGVSVIESMTGDVKKVLEKPATKIIRGMNNAVICADDKQFIVSPEGTLVESPVKYAKALEADVIEARICNGKEIVLNDKRILSYNGVEVEAYTNNEKILIFEVINECGRVDADGEYLIIVTEKHAFLYDINDQLKRIRKKSFDNTADEASIFEWGGMIVRSKQVATILPLPDYTLDSLGTLSINKSTMAIVKKQGLIVQDQESILLYSNDHMIPQLFNESTPAIPEPEKKSFFGFKKANPNLSEVDEKFGYKRAQSNTNEALQTMQELLVVAQERSEKLTEMEMKANRLRDHAREFREQCRKFKR